MSITLVSYNHKGKLHVYIFVPIILNVLFSGARENKEDEWTPVTKLGRLVKDKKITTLEEIYLNSLPIKVR